MAVSSRSLSIRAKTVLISVLVTAFTTASFTVAYVAIARAAAVSNLEETVNRSVGRLRDGLELPLWNLDYPACRLLVRGELNDANLLAVAVRDESGNIVAAYGRDASASLDREPAEARELDASALLILLPEASFSASSEVNHEGVFLGGISVYGTFGPSEVSLAASATVAALLALFVGAGIAMALFFFMDRAVTARLTRLDLVLERFAGKDFGARSMESGRDVIGHLAASYNAMAETIQGYNRDLQSMVEERTSRLIEAEKLAFLGGLAAGVAHEVNTPLGVAVTASSHARSVVSGLLDAYRAGSIDEEGFLEGMKDTLEAFDIVGSNLQRAAEFIRTFKKLAADQAVEEPREVKVAEYIHETLVSLRPRLKHRNVRVDLRCPESLAVMTVPSALYQIVTNLVTNSLMHAFDEGGSGTITIDVAHGDGELSMVYRDDGKGIAPEHLGSLFTPFFTTKRGAGGTGLGLHIIKNLATKMGGTVTCSSEPGKGVEFVVRLPAPLARTGGTR